MFPNEFDVMMKQEQVKDWLGEAEHDRLLETIRYANSTRQPQRNAMAGLLGIRLIDSIWASLKAIRRTPRQIRRDPVVGCELIDSCAGQDC